MANTIRGRAEIGASGIAQVRLLISHPMTIESRDAATGRTIPAHFIEEVVCEHGGEVVFRTDWGQAVSLNPFLSFALSGVKAGDTITVKWRDNRGTTDNATITVS